MAELSVERCEIPLLIVGISGDQYSKICIFNPNTRKVVRTLRIDTQVSDFIQFLKLYLKYINFLDVQFCLEVGMC